MRPSKLLGGFRECASLPLPGTAQRAGSGFRDANKLRNLQLMTLVIVDELI